MRGPLRAFLLAGAVGLTALLPASGAFAAPVDVSGGSGDWGVKLSFRNYIAGPIAHGDIAVSDGASVNVDGTYDFPVVERRRRPRRPHRRGAAPGHRALPRARDARRQRQPPPVRDHHQPACGARRRRRGALRGRDQQEPVDGRRPTRSRTSKLGESRRDRARARSTGDHTLTWTAIPATLTAEGAPAFAGFYTEGTVLDPVALDLTYADAPADREWTRSRPPSTRRHPQPGAGPDLAGDQPLAIGTGSATPTTSSSSATPARGTRPASSTSASFAPPLRQPDGPPRPPRPAGGAPGPEGPAGPQWDRQAPQVRQARQARKAIRAPAPASRAEGPQGRQGRPRPQGREGRSRPEGRPRPRRP